MTDEGRKLVVADETARAREELAATHELLQLGFARIALTRSYFALFHALRALLYVHGHEPKSHRGALALFGLHFVRTGRYEPDVARVLSNMQKFREDADYAEGFVADPVGIAREIAGARALAERLLADVDASIAAT